MLLNKTARNVLQIQNPLKIAVRRKNSGSFMKRWRKEDKLAFGPLVETKKEKEKRLKLETKGQIPVKKDLQINTETIFLKKFKKESESDNVISSRTAQKNCVEKDSVKSTSNVKTKGKAPIKEDQIILEEAMFGMALREKSNTNDFKSLESVKTARKTSSGGKVSHKIIILKNAWKYNIIQCKDPTPKIETIDTKTQNSSNVKLSLIDENGANEQSNETKNSSNVKLSLIDENGANEQSNETKNSSNVKLSLIDENSANEQSNETILRNDIKDGLYGNTSLFPNVKKNLSIADESKDVLTLSSKNCKNHIRYPSVTRILDATMSEEARALLNRWESKMIEKLGIQGFKIYRQELLRNGKYLHSAIHKCLLSKPLDIHENIKLAFKSVNNILKDMCDVKAIESHVVHPQLHYRGYLDCIATYRGKLCVIDWKKSDKQKSSIMSTYDAPLQVASYIGALNADDNYPFQIECGLIVVAYTNGNQASVHEISGNLLQLYWERWLERLQKYQREA